MMQRALWRRDMSRCVTVSTREPEKRQLKRTMVALLRFSTGEGVSEPLSARDLAVGRSCPLSTMIATLATTTSSLPLLHFKSYAA